MSSVKNKRTAGVLDSGLTDVLGSVLNRSLRFRRVFLKPLDDLGFSDLPDLEDFVDFDLSDLPEG